MTDIMDKIKVMEAFADGKAIEYRHFGWPEWHDCAEPAWSWAERDYRIKPEPEPTHDVIPWDMINEDFMWAARNHDGQVCLFTDAPSLRAMAWSVEGGTFRRIDTLLNIKQGGLPWHKTLQCRPLEAA